MKRKLEEKKMLCKLLILKDFQEFKLLIFYTVWGLIGVCYTLTTNGNRGLKSTVKSTGLFNESLDFPLFLTKFELEEELGVNLPN